MPQNEIVKHFGLSKSLCINESKLNQLDFLEWCEFISRVVIAEQQAKI